LGKFDAYKIDLKGLQANSAVYEFLLDSLFFTHIDSPEIQKGKVKVTVRVNKVSVAFELNFQTKGVVWIPCDRCLDEMEQEIESSNDKLVVKLGHEYAEESDNLIIIPEKEGSINIAWFIYEFIVLAIPMKHVHLPGKCNKTITSKLQKYLKINDNEEDNKEVGLSGETGGMIEDIDIGAEDTESE
jgi:uncharacterized metal-binding protein YceD (DUF177 family)